jgi:hypothetical protein
MPEPKSDWQKIEKLRTERDALVKALKEIDAIAVSKKAGAAKRMQAIARDVLSTLSSHHLGGADGA